MSIFNWDVIIAKYNFSHADTAFVYFDFMSNLSNNALPYLDKTDLELSMIDSNQKDEFEFRTQYMSSADYHDKIQQQKSEFIEQWPNKCWLEWNWAGERSYNKLKNGN